MRKIEILWASFFLREKEQMVIIDMPFLLVILILFQSVKKTKNLILNAYSIMQDSKVRLDFLEVLFLIFHFHFSELKFAKKVHFQFLEMLGVFLSKKKVTLHYKIPF